MLTATTEVTPEAVTSSRVRFGPARRNGDGGVRLIWGSDLEAANTVLMRFSAG